VKNTTTRSKTKRTPNNTINNNFNSIRGRKIPSNRKRMKDFATSSIDVKEFKHSEVKHIIYDEAFR